jgi:hypothetical protein
VDILNALENNYSTATIKKIAKLVCEQKAKLNELLSIFLGGEKKIAHRAAWALQHVAENKPELIVPHFKDLLKKLAIPNQHTSIYRSIFKCFQESEIPEKYVAQIFDASLIFMMSEIQEAAVRAYAITTASNICKTYPELKSELKLVLNEMMTMPQSKAVTVRAKRAFKDL